MKIAYQLLRSISLILIKWLFFIKKGMGRIYIEGIKEGIKLSLSAEGKLKKVRFCQKHIGNYIQIQFALWINTLRRFTG